MNAEFVTLHFSDGRSDKIYQAAIREVGEQYEVHFAYGRRGSTLTTGTKTTRPVSWDEAVRIFERLVGEKMKKGYRSVDGGGGYTVAAPDSTGILPQLLTPVEDGEIDDLLADDRYLLQPKLDGKHLMLRKTGTEITGINRRGLACGIPESLRASALELPGDWLLDGECIGDQFHAFDLLEHDGSFRHRQFKDRLMRLLYLLESGHPAGIHFVAATYGKRTKRRVFEMVREEGGEGVVFKKMDAAYIPGRPSSGGDQRKFKFVETASVIVTRLNDKRSVQLGVMDAGTVRPAGNVTIPVGSAVPNIGDVVEVRYLYAFPESGSLYQPVYLGVRDDIEASECTRDQLKWKRESQLHAA